MFFSEDSTAVRGQTSVRRAAKSSGHAGFRAHPRTLSLGQRAVKRAMDIVGALAFFALFAPLLLAIALCVGLSSGWPVHFRQTRMGRGGSRFHFYKFRSMVTDSDRVLRELLDRDPDARAEWNAFQHLRKDPRITRIGRYLRKSSFDEFPQFWNVLIGDMSLVGPRPCLERQASMFGDAWGHYCAVRPGISGLWQVSGRNQLTFAQRVELDVYYVENWSIRLDLSILLKTTRAVFAGD
ncbi:sugar transferase [Variovorax sp. RHLX14]|uniref:sugar transferase n=1 Tax=Variovorax sp. RHLX14 TaxID=1259731 RepID=UPI003F4682FD